MSKVEVFSMTGFGAGALDTNIGAIQIEIRSVNSRFLDLTTYAPTDRIRSLEPKFRQLLTSHPAIKRGKIECRFYFAKSNNGSAEPLSLNSDVLEQVKQLQSQIQATMGTAPMSTNEILLFPGVLNTKNDIDPIYEEQLLNAFSACLDKFVESRQLEGKKLSDIMFAQCDEIDRLVTTLRPKLPAILQSVSEKLQKRLEEALSEQLSQNSLLSVDEINERIRQEVTLYATKMDVAEEMDRLLTHTANIRTILNQGGATLGRRLDFTIQELNRESNTLASKASAIEMTNTAVDLKLVIEQMREQIQNMQ